MSAIVGEDCLFSFGDKQEVALELFLLVIKNFEGFNGFEKIGRGCQGFFGCLVNNLVQIAEMHKRDHGTGEVRVKCFRLPEAEAEPEIMVLLFLGFGIEGETIGAGLLHWFAAVHSFAQDEKGEWASHLVGAVSGDFLHIESFWEVSPIFPLAPLPKFF